jgi:DNA-binding transcriptional ArsR family regulator
MDDTAIALLARLFKLLGDLNRLRIVFALGKDSKPVSEIMQQTRLPQTLVSFHLRPLRESGILSTERRGAFVYYRVADPGLIDLLASLGGVPFKQGSKEEVQGFVFPPMRFMCRWMKGDE